MTANLFTNPFVSSKKIIRNIQTRLLSLEEELKRINAMDNKVESIVCLFKVISPIQDADGFKQEISVLKKRNRRGKLNVKIAALETIQVHIYNAGRSEFGINRTAKGEEVTTEKVFLGNVFGIWTKPAVYWLDNKPELEKELRPDVSRDTENPVSNWYLINSYCDNFVKSHVDGILQQIKVLKTAA